MPTALVTGSGKRRIGSYVADALAERGYAVVLHYRTSRKEAEESAERLRARGTRVLLVQADLCDESAVQRIVKQTIETFGGIDVLVTAASEWSSKPLEDATADDVRRFFESNTLSTYLCCKQAGLAMTRQPAGGCIVTIGDWAIARPYVDYPAYFPSKGAIPTLTRTFAVELAERNPAVRVNCILPGPVMLPADLPEAERREAIDATLVRREGRPQNIAHAVLFLVDNDFITGACLPIDGGRSISG